MRHGNKVKKLQRRKPVRDLLIGGLIVSLIEHRRIRTTLAKAKALRPFAERMLTIGKKAVAANEGRTDTNKDTPAALHFRRQAIAKLYNNVKAVQTLVNDIAPAHKERQGGYTRIVKLGQRRSDSAPMAIIEWVDTPKTLGAVTVAEGDEATPAVIDAEEVKADAAK